MKMNKSKVLVIALAVCLIATLSFGTLAWFNATKSITNTFMVSDTDNTDGDNLPDFDIKLFETENGQEVDGKQFPAVMPNSKLAKDPTVRNTGDYKLYTRVIVTLSDAETWRNASRTYNLMANEDEILEKLIDKNANWIRYDNAKYDATANTLTYVYYYNGVVDSNAVTAPVFETVTIPSQLQQKDMDYGDDLTFSINVKADAIQAENIIAEGASITGNEAYTAFNVVANWTAGTEYGA